MKTKRIVSFILTMLLLLNVVVISTSAKTMDVAKTGSIAVEITSYEQLKNELYNAPNGDIFVLKNDIIVDDNENDNTIQVSGLTKCTLDLNGYTLKRSTRGIDNCLIQVMSGAEFSVVDSSDDNSGEMIFCSGNYSGTSSVILANGNVDIYGGNFRIETPYEVGGGAVFLLETGYMNIYNGVFDSHEAFGGDTIELRHNAYLYTVPHCNIFGGTFYGKISNFEVSSYRDFSSYGCLYPSVYVFDGEFYIAQPDHEYAGFAYCNNGWGQVIVAGGTVYYKCLNSSDQKFIDGVSKAITNIEFAGKSGYYYEVTPPVMIGCEDLSLTDHLGSMIMKKDVSYYSKNGTVYKENQEMIDSVLSHIDTIEVFETQEESPLMWIENTENVKTVSWYMSDEENYDDQNTPWTELMDFRGNVLPFRFDFRPEEETTLYISALITMDDGSEIEDVIAIYYQQFKPNPPITAVDVTGVTAPVVGENPDFSLDDTSQYYINGVFWTDVTTSSHKSLKETDVFEEGHTYELEVWLRANDGYKFKMDSDDFIDITATIGDKRAEVIPPGAENTAIISVRYTVEDEAIMLGDVDNDSKISIMDATAIQLHIAKTKILSEDALSRADTDKDSKVSVMDATAIQRYVAKVITEF